MDEQDEPRPEPAPRRRWLGWALMALGAAGGLWLAALPLDQMLPEPGTRRSSTPEAPGGAVAPESAPPDAAPALGESPPAIDVPLAPVPEAEAIDPPATTPSAEWVEEEPGEGLEEQAPVQEALRARLERQLQMNDLGGVRVAIVGDRVVTSGSLSRPGDRQRVALLVRSLAPDLVHEDQALDAGDRP